MSRAPEELVKHGGGGGGDERGGVGPPNGARALASVPDAATENNEKSPGAQGSGLTHSP